MNITYIARTEADCRALGTRFAAHLAAGDVVFLTGDLGAGKSVFARGVAAGFGITSPMPSPTFTLMQPYEGSLPVYHFDLYRLADSDELYAAGLDEFLFGQGVSLVEWPYNALEEADATAFVDITVQDDGSRRIDIRVPRLAEDREETL